MRFSLRGPADGWYDAASGWLRLGGAELVRRSELQLLGDHNVANALAAALAALEAGVAPGVLAEGLRSFAALPHRLEPVREVGGVLWINDSKATNIASTVVAVQAMARPFVLLLGGRHKGEPYTRLAPLLRARCRSVSAYGEAGPLIESDLGGGDVPLERGTTFEDVIARARRAAQPVTRPAVTGVLELRHVQDTRARSAIQRVRGRALTDAGGSSPARVASAILVVFDSSPSTARRAWSERRAAKSARRSRCASWSELWSGVWWRWHWPARTTTAGDARRGR